MNCPSRVDADLENDTHNQSPPSLAADLTTNNDLNGIANSRERRGHRTTELDTDCADRIPDSLGLEPDDRDGIKGHAAGEKSHDVAEKVHVAVTRAEPNGEGKETEKGKAGVVETLREPSTSTSASAEPSQDGRDGWRKRCCAGVSKRWNRTCAVLKKFVRFIGPGFMVAVAYIDPGNYATDVAAGASFKFKLLFIILMSNIFAIFLQTLCIRLGTVTGMNLAENCRAHLPRWLNYVLYVFAEAAIIATDIAEVIGTAIALNLLLHIPLVAGCAISIVDVLIILAFYHPTGSMRGLRVFEIGVALLVVGVVIAFSFQLSLIKNTTAGEVFKGYLPSSALIKSKGLYQSCGILGATVMPHSLYLGSGVVQSRLRHFDIKHNNTGNGFTNLPSDSDSDHSYDGNGPQSKYRPSLSAIRSCLNYSVVELAISLFTFALFVNSAILITAGASLHDNKEAASADLFGIHELLSRSLAPAAGTVFALALLFSGTSAGIVCTIAGQMVSEGQLNLSMRPWLRRLLTRSISITPSIIIAGAVGKEGLSTALEASQVALSVILPFVSAPLIWFTCRNSVMTVVPERIDSVARSSGSGGSVLTRGEHEGGEAGSTPAPVRMRNSWPVAAVAGIIWTIIVVMNIALLVLVGSGKD